jgi:hypothetical protein
MSLVLPILGANYYMVGDEEFFSITVSTFDGEELFEDIPSDLSKCYGYQLEAICKFLGIKNISKMNKQEKVVSINYRSNRFIQAKNSRETYEELTQETNLN